MKRPSLIRRLLNKVRPGKTGETAAAPSAPAPDPSLGKPNRPRAKTDSSFEPLEGRIAPAVLLNASTIQFTDSDGDLVTVQFSKSLFQPGLGLNTTLDSVFLFKTGDAKVRTATEGGSASDVHELGTLDLAVLAAIGQKNPANGVNVSITAVQQSGAGDGAADVGYIKAAHSSLFGIQLGKVVVDGDLGRIDAGDRTKSIGIKSINVGSWGALGTTTQLAGGNLDSFVTSGIGSMTVHGDFKDAALRVSNGDSPVRNEGQIGKILIEGDILTSAANGAANIGAIATAGDIGSISVHSILGGAGLNTGKISAGGKIGSVTMTGDLRGGGQKDSGQIVASDGIGKVTLHTLWAGSGEASGRIVTEGNIGSVTLEEIAGHHTISGTSVGKNAATISAGGKIGSLEVAGNVSGGAGDTSGRVAAGNTLGKVSIGGHLIGGAGASSGQILAGVSIGSISIDGAIQDYISVEQAPGEAGVQEKHILEFGDVLGRQSSFTLSFIANGSPQTTVALSSASTAGEIQAALNALPGIGADGVTVALLGGRIEITFTTEGDKAGRFEAAVTQASVVGGTGSTSGTVSSNGSIGKVSVQNLATGGAALKAGNGVDSGSISAGTSIGKIELIGDVDGSGAATISGGGSITVGQNLKSLTITGDLIGGGGHASGSVTAQGTIGKIKVTGSLVGGGGDTSGSITAAGKISSAFVTGSLVGGAGGGSASLVAGTDITAPSDFTKVTVLGQLIGDGLDSATIRAGGKLGTVTVGTLGAGSGPVLNGGDGTNSGSIVGRTGIKNVTVNGNVAGGDGDNSGTIQSSVKIDAAKVIGNLVGGEGTGSGSIMATDLPDTFPVIPGTLGKITVTGNLIGDVGTDSGQIRADGSIQSVTVGGLSGGDGSGSGSIVAGRGESAFLDEFRTIGGIAKVVVNGTVTGNADDGSGSIQAGARIANLIINGAVTGSALKTGRDFGSILINGNVSDALISAEGSATATAKADVAIAKLTVNGSVANSLVQAGYDVFGIPVNGNAQIGDVKVSQNWTASSIVAGVVDVDGDGFGDEDGDIDDTVIGSGTLSRIASIVIGGSLTGTAEAGDHFGFVAQDIGSVKIGSVTHALTSGKNTIPLAGTPVTDDTSIHEVP